MMPTELGTQVTVEELPDLEQAPPCDTFWRNRDPAMPDIPCGKPSVVHVHIVCNVCGSLGSNFLCAECLRDLQQHNMHCPVCFRNQRPPGWLWPWSKPKPTTDYTYQET
jgi:hypothetical protein